MQFRDGLESYKEHTDYMDGIKVPLKVFEKKWVGKICVQQILKSSTVQQK